MFDLYISCKNLNMYKYLRTLDKNINKKSNYKTNWYVQIFVTTALFPM